MSYTIALSGPADSRAAAEVALEDAGLALLPSDHHALMDWRSKFPDTPDDVAWITVLGKDVNAAVRAVEPCGWALRVHSPTPVPPKPSDAQVLTATIAEMRADIDALKAKVG
jgi:hypothetical protein